MRIYIAAALVAAAMASPAFAQEQTANFQGVHVDLIGGYDLLSAGGEHESGGAYGIAAGYDFQRENVVFGIEAEAAESTGDVCDAGICLDAGRDLYVGGRVGAVVSDVALIYAKAGYTNARFELTPAVLGDNDATLDGVRGGVGIEWATGTPVIARVEYRYSNYESDLSRHQGVVGIGLRF
jgi:outer membrane immunogenic protein